MFQKLWNRLASLRFIHTVLALYKFHMTFLDKKEPKLPRMDWNEYHRLATIHTFMDDLEYNYPSICTTGAIGKSLEGRDLKVRSTYEYLLLQEVKLV